MIASVYLSGTNTRRVKRALFALFKGAVSKDVVSRAWRRVKADRDAWCTRSLADEDIIRLILDGTVIKTRIDRKATNISVLAALRGNGLAIQRCTVHKHCNLPGHAPKHMHEELTADYRDMIYAETAREVEKRRKAFLRKWRLKCRAVADSLEEAADRLFTFIRLAPSQWKSARTTNAIERLNEEFRRRMKTQTVLPCAETVPMLLWALLASGQIRMRKVDGWETLTQPALPMPLDFAA